MNANVSSHRYIPPESILYTGPGQCPKCYARVVRVLTGSAVIGSKRNWVSAELEGERYVPHVCPEPQAGRAA